jgi:hypothetical protein
MTKSAMRVGVLTAALAWAVASLHAQFVVYDPSNYFEAVAELAQLVRQYEFLIRQAAQLPVDIESRYHAYSFEWSLHDPAAGVLYAQQLLTALNQGDPSGAAYRGLVGSLDLPTDVVGRMAPGTRQRFEAAYGTVELADSTNRLAIDQTGAARADGPLTLQAIRNVEHDAINPADDFRSQTALLQKIDSAFAIDLRLNEITNQFQLSALEQAIVDNTRKRDTEATLMNATIHQWRYGQAYGDDLFSRTAANIDTWRPF